VIWVLAHMIEIREEEIKKLGSAIKELECLKVHKE